MKFDAFVQRLRDSGWDNPCDAQCSDIRKFWAELFPHEVYIEQLEDEVNRLDQLLVDIGDTAHNNSTGPAVPDMYWYIRQKAYQL